MEELPNVRDCMLRCDLELKVNPDSSEDMLVLVGTR
jgi:hypothetical protein